MCIVTPFSCLLWEVCCQLECPSGRWTLTESGHQSNPKQWICLLSTADERTGEYIVTRMCPRMPTQFPLAVGHFLFSLPVNFLLILTCEWVLEELPIAGSLRPTTQSKTLIVSLSGSRLMNRCNTYFLPVSIEHLMSLTTWPPHHVRTFWLACLLSCVYFGISVS